MCIVEVRPPAPDETQPQLECGPGQQTAYTNNQAFDDVQADMTALEPNITWVHEAAATSTGNSVSLFTAATNSDFVYLQGLSKDGHCYTVVQVNNPGITTPATGYNEGASGTACAAPPSLPSRVRCWLATPPPLRTSARPRTSLPGKY